VFIGGIAENFESSYRIGGGRDFVIEGDEYDSAFFDKTAKFLKYVPDIAVVNNIEFDHADIYPDLDAIRLAFRRFVNLVPRRGLLLLGADNPDALALRSGARCPVQTFGLSQDADWQAHDLKISATATTFGVRRDKQSIGTFELPLLGAYNVRNALAAIATGAAVGLHTSTMVEGLRKFRGVRRRLEHRGTASGVAVYDDFAHHPTAIGETLEGIRSAYPDRRIWAIFEPRSATSCRRIFHAEFLRALAKADRVILPAVFRSTLPEASSRT
jgi:UDP-N-acetylmuramate: L-alanyl-gamma-D-glutamyl-meso-diaminopimelate ligase